MSSGPGGKRGDLLKELSRELRQFNGLGASFFRAAAARLGLTVTDMQVIDLLDGSGPMTAGQLADLTGLTTGAITGMLNRLEESGLVRRERDPNDGRRVIVRLEGSRDETHQLGPLFDSLGQGWEKLAASYTDEQVATLLYFLKSNNELTRREIMRLREGPPEEAGIFSAKVGGLERAKLVISAGISRLTLQADAAMTDLYQAKFQGPTPEVKTKEGVITMRYPRRLWGMADPHKTAVVKLNATIPWDIQVEGGPADIAAELVKLNLASLEVKGGLSMIRLTLPPPTGIIPIKISGSASHVIVLRPQGVAARVHLKGWVSDFTFDGQLTTGIGNDVRLTSTGYRGSGPCYDIEVKSSASSVLIG